MKRPIGLHLRFDGNLADLPNKASLLESNTFQFFLPQNITGRNSSITQQDKDLFALKTANKLETVFVHGAYWITLATGNKKALSIARKRLTREITLLSELGIPFLVLHAGSSTDHPFDHNDPYGKLAGIQTVAKTLNLVLETAPTNVTILLENTAHGKHCIGSDIKDFALLLPLLNHPNRVKFCIDLAHAFAFGYNLLEVETFISLLRDTLGIENIMLIHLHDSAEKMESKLDKHTIPGEGYIGKTALRQIVGHEDLKSIPIILELPDLPLSTEKIILDEVKTWN